ncbi:hypothetical protein SLS57_008014 [Botryosphaeria dothidea]
MALETAASVIAVIQVSVKIIDTCWEYRKLQNASKEAAKLISHLEGLNSILRNLIQVLEDESAKSGHRLLNTVELVKTGQLNHLKVTLDRLHGDLQPLHGFLKVKHAILFPMKQKEIEETLHGIENVKSTIIMALELDSISTVIETLELELKHQEAQAVVFFYFDFADEEKQSVKALIRSLIVQLASKTRGQCQQLKELFKSRRPGQSLPQTKVLLSVLMEQVQLFEDVYLIIDALDESKNLKQLLDTLEIISKWSASNLHIMASSRDTHEVKRTMSRISASELAIGTSLVSQDIATYVEDEICSDELLSLWSPEIRTKIQEQIQQKAQGMTPRLLWERLASLPPSLEDVYERILLAIPPYERESSLRTLEWVAFAARPVRINELAEALAVDLQDFRGYNSDNKDISPHTAPILASPLITTSEATVYEVKALPSYYLDAITVMNKAPSDVVRLSHASVKDYLLSVNVRQGKAAFYALNMALANRKIAETCLLYLMAPAIHDGALTLYQQGRRLEKWPLLLYAAHFWPHHINANEKLEDRTWQLMQSFFATRELPKCGNFGLWAKTLTPVTPFEFIGHTSPLYYAASFGMAPVVRNLLEFCPEDLHRLGGRYKSTPLQSAAFRGHYAVVKLLLDAGSDFRTASYQSNGTPLVWALRQYKWDVATLLLQYGATLSDVEYVALKTNIGGPDDDWPDILTEYWYKKTVIYKLRTRKRRNDKTQKTRD